VEVTKEVVKENTVEKTVEKVVEVTAAPKPEWTTAHPILGDVKVRQAIAHCTNREALVGAVYPYLAAEERGKMLMDTWIPKSSPFYAAPSVQYTFDITKAGTLLDEAGWKLPEGGNVRQNADGDPMVLRFTSSVTPAFRPTVIGPVFEKQMAACGIIIQRSHIPGAIWFGSNSGVRRRDFDLGEFAWVGEPDPGGTTLYSCESIPTPANGWSGQNGMGWCNETASAAIKNANNTLDVEERKKLFAIHQDEFAKDMVSLPLFQRSEAIAFNTKLKGISNDPTEYYTANSQEWEGKDTVVLAFTQEPASMFSLVESAAVQTTIALLIGGARNYTQYSYGYQPSSLADDTFPTIENGGATNTDVELKDGDKFVATDGNVYQLKDGKVIDLEGKDKADAKVKSLKGEETTAAVGAKAPQIVVTHRYKPAVWSDGKPVVKADRELGVRVDCEKTSGAVSYDGCDRTAKVEVTDDNTVVTTLVPGYQPPFYYLPGGNGYPSHQIIASDGAYKGKTLAEVAPKDFATLPEIAERPMGAGPFMIESWEKGQKMTLVVNPNYVGTTPKVKKIIVQFYADAPGALAAFLNGENDVVGKETLGGGAEIESLLKAKADGKAIEVAVGANPTWEHIDFNLNVR
jgi:ABC-type transport system substrate-binding protein